MNEVMTQGFYTAFVRNLVKWQPTPAEDMVHACIGIVGEVIELRFATSRDNAVEELGDLEFYLKHAWIVAHRLQADNVRFPVITSSAVPITWDQCIQDLTHAAGELVDYSKKAWIYNKPWEALDFLTQLHRVGIALSGLYQHLGIDKLSVRERNVVKLKARYPQGYSDAAAQARADKVV